MNELRKTTRFVPCSEAVCRVFVNHEQLCDAEIVNVSRDGLCLKLNRSLTVATGDHVSLMVEDPFTLLKLHLDVILRWTHEVDLVQQSVGVEFRDLSAAGRDSLAELLGLSKSMVDPLTGMTWLSSL